IEPVKILVVDDEEIVLRFACDALRSEGHLVVGVFSAQEALKRVKEEKYDFILTDIKMPEMDGVELIKAAHQIDSNIGALFMTGYASLETAREAVQEGVYDYILKPFDLHEIRRAVADAIQKRRKVWEGARGKELSRLSDLHKILYTAGDKRGLLKWSLGFALMQCNLNVGSVIFWNEKTSEVELFLCKDLSLNLFEETKIKIDEEKIREWLQIEDVVQAKNLQEHPVFHQLYNLDPQVSIINDIFQEGYEITSIPIRKGEWTCGLLSLKGPSPQSKIAEVDLKLLTIIAVQTAILIENLSLLEESRRSYQELENLQEQMIGLESMAAKGRASAEIGHELNNYLTVIMGNFQLLNMNIDKTDAKNLEDLASLGKYVNVIDTNLEKTKKFVDGLLDFSSLKSEKTECDINELIEKTLLFVSPQNRFENISFKKELAEEIQPAVVDPGQIQQVLYNLLNNAADAMGKRIGEGGSITIGTDYDKKEKMVHIWIKDTGCGMSEEEMKRIFQGSFTTKTSGHGIGLSICKKI
ncbi:MAG: response regulator, partial [candidate division Zixibacteria bacterium]|nr:response regulator [candidate division Zixibacteria bacterium]